MKVNLTIEQAVDIAKMGNARDGSHLFSIHEGLEHVAVVYKGGVLFLPDDIPLMQLQDENIQLSVNSMDNELRDVQSLREYGVMYADLQADAKLYVDKKFEEETGMDICDPLSLEIISVYGAGSKLPSIEKLQDEALLSILREKYSGGDIISTKIADDGTIFVFYRDEEKYRTTHYRLADFEAMNSHIVSSLERKKEDLEMRIALHKQYEKTMVVEKSNDLTV